MKKLLIAPLFIAAILVACSKKVVPDTGAKPDTKTEETKVETAKTKTEAEIKAELEEKAKVEQAEKPAAPTPVMTDMDHGKAIYSSKCNSCHAMKTIGNYSFFQWQSILRSMVPKAKLSGDEERQVTAYIKANAKQ